MPQIDTQGSCCCCRGAHQSKIGPLELKPVVQGGAGFLQADVQVPEDASVLDMEFSDSGGSSGGFVDSNHGLGYHIPIRGSRVPQPSLSICHISVEMAPIAKVSHHICSTSLSPFQTCRLQPIYRASCTGHCQFNFKNCLQLLLAHS